MYLAMSYGGREGIRRLQNPVVSSGIVHRSSSPGVVELSKETSIQNSKDFCFASATRLPVIEILNRAH